MEMQFRRSVLSGRIAAPPSPAASQRALIAASLASGQSVISNLAESKDVQSTIQACRALGADIVTEGNIADVFGGSFSPPPVLDCGASASTLKLFMGLCLSFPDGIEFRGSEGLEVTPLGPYLGYLQRLGAGVEGREGFLPVKITGPATESELVYPAQLGTPFLSGMLLASPLSEKEIEIGIEGTFPSPQPIADTISIMEECGISFTSNEPDYIAISGGQPYSPLSDFEVPPSAGLSSYIALAAALCGRATVDFMPHSPRLESLFKSFGADAASGEDGFFVSAGPLQGAELDAAHLGSLLLHAIVLGSVAHGETRISNFAALGRRAGDRVRLLIKSLSRMGANINESEHNLIINGARLTGTEIDPEGDAHVAMVLSAAALSSDGPTHMRGAECVQGCYPSFFSDLAKLGAIAREVQELR